MPELAEVEYFRKKWDAGLNKEVRAVELHAGKKVFRGTDEAAMVEALQGARLLGSEAKGKQMMFRFSGGAWLGVHLGMSGAMRTEAPDFTPEKHDHLALRQAKQTLIYRDPRMFGRVRFNSGEEPPKWWADLPPALTGPEFTLKYVRAVLTRRKRAPLKAILLNQQLFIGIGNWMADEILWQARLAPDALGGALSPAESKRLWQKTQYVCRVAMETIGVDWGDPPKDWLIHVRWKAGGLCPHDGHELERGTVAGRTTAWCARCQTGGLPEKPKRARAKTKRAPEKPASLYSERKAVYRPKEKAAE